MPLKRFSKDSSKDPVVFSESATTVTLVDSRNSDIIASQLEVRRATFTVRFVRLATLAEPGSVRDEQLS